MALTTPYSYWTLLVSYTSALSQLALTYHWQTRGGHYYSDHQLYQRIYDETYAELDGFAERAIGVLNNPNVVHPTVIAANVLTILEVLTPGAKDLSPDDMPIVLLNAEKKYLDLIDEMLASLDAQGSRSHVVEDMLQAIANLHQTHVYLLQQRTNA